MREYSWVVGVLRGAQANDLRRVHQEIACRGRTVVTRRDRMADRVCEVLRAYEVNDGMPAACFQASNIAGMPARFSPQQNDVAIDFPSVSELVERGGVGLMEDEAPCVMEVGLCWREAFRGANVALEVPVHCTCLACGGRGEMWNDTCSMCRGVGTEPQQHLVRLSIPPGVRPNARFRFVVNPPYAPETSVEVRVTIQ